MIWLLCALAWGGAEAPSDQTLVYYNARLALREGRSLDATRLWLLRNAVRDATGLVSTHDDDFHSVTWAALGDLGICPDGHPLDTDGAGLWPLALHNYIIRNRGRRGRPERPKTFEAFQLDRQQRFVGITDVLSAQELNTVTLFRGACLRHWIAMMAAGETVNASLADRQVATRVLLYLLDLARSSLDSERVRGMSVLEARRFDMHLQLTELAERQARMEARERARQGREGGLSRRSTDAMTASAVSIKLDRNSEAAAILEACVYWSVDEWMALSPDRRLFLFVRARRWGGPPAELDRIALGVIDRLIAEGEGVEAARWIAHRDEQFTELSAVWSGARGAGLLSLDGDSGFRERSVIALHRGVDQLMTGNLDGALRSMAYALNAAQESSVADEVASLSLRWLTYIAAQFEITDELLITLKALVPRTDYDALLEDLMWSAALRADARSFARGLEHQSRRGALERRLAWLDPLSQGNVSLFMGRLRESVRESPNETLRFLDQLAERLEREDAGVRQSQVTTLKEVRRLVRPLADDPEASSRQIRAATRLLERTLAIVEGVEALGVDAAAWDRARSNNPDAEVYAGAVRLAPSDPLPWPFQPMDVSAPSIFMPMKLVPEEWQDSEGQWVFGWRVEG